MHSHVSYGGLLQLVARIEVDNIRATMSKVISQCLDTQFVRHGIYTTICGLIIGLTKCPRRWAGG